MAKKEIHLGVGVPGGTGYWVNDMAMSLIHLTTAMLTIPVPGYAKQQMSVLSSKSSLLPKARNELIVQALAQKCTHLLFIDTDQTFPSWTAHAMVSRRLPVVAANVPIKSIPSKPSARNYNPAWWGGDIVDTGPDSTGVQQVWRVGTGIMLVDLSILEKVQKPYFSTDWRVMPDGTEECIGEDWWFCERLEAAGIPIHIDHDVSIRVGHVGNFEFTHALVWAEDQIKAFTDEKEKAIDEKAEADLHRVD